MLEWFRRKFFAAANPPSKRIPVIARNDVDNFPAPAAAPSKQKLVSVALPAKRDSGFTRSALNVPGPFYSCGDCLACGLPECEAPDLLAPLDEDNRTTYFVKQPETAEEIERACRAILVCCINDLRYGGQDRNIIERLGNDPRRSDFIIRDGEVVRATTSG